jgi:hypothetical protein
MGAPPAAFSWASLLNCYFWLDRVKHVTGVLFTQILPFYDDRVVVGPALLRLHCESVIDLYLPGSRRLGGRTLSNGAILPS